MSVLAVAAKSFRRLTRDRTALFFLLVLPALIILVLGVVVGRTDTFRVGVLVQEPGTESLALTDGLTASSGIRLERFEDRDAMTKALRRGELDTAVVLPAGIDASLQDDRTVEVEVMVDQTNSTQRAAAQVVTSVIRERGARLAAANVYREQAGGSLAAGLDAAARVASDVDAVTVEASAVDAKSDILPGGFGYTVPTELVLFVFITSLAGGASMIESRRLGVHDRMLAAPMTSRAIVVGEALSFFTIALLQSAIIVGLGSTLFGVSWGDPLAAVCLVAVWALVGAGAGMLAGTLFRTEEQTTAVGPTVGIAFGMLGGCMWPLEIVPQAVRTAGHVVPHAWAVDGWIKILSHGSSLGGILPQLAALGAFAAVLFGVASVRLRHRLTA